MTERTLQLSERYGLSVRYQLLGRLASDCRSYLGGFMGECQLWSGSIKEQIEDMKDLYNSFSEEEKPEWISLEDIENYRKEMTR